MRKTICSVLDSLTTTVVTVGMVLPPWNLFWWGFGYSVVKLGEIVSGQRDASGDVGLSVVFLPGIVAAAPLAVLREAWAR